MKHLALLLALLCVATTVLVSDVIIPRNDARRLEVLFFGAPTANHPSHNPVTRYRILKKHLGNQGMNLSYTEDPAEAFNAETLAKYDALVMYGNWDRNGALPASQEKALLDFVENGGGFVPIHCASACYGGSEAFVNLVGGRFKSHGTGVFAPKTVQPDNPVMKGSESFEAWDESYVHDRLSDDRTVLQERDGEPWTWIRTQGKGRVFYTASGHDHRVWDLPEFGDLVRRGIHWAVGDEKTAMLSALSLPKFEMMDVELPGYREKKLITSVPKPFTPEESLKLAQIPPGFELSLFASEPDIVNPISINWDERGRAFVVETIDYPNNHQMGKDGDGGIDMTDKSRDTSSHVGYIQPVEMVNVVHLTHTAHHPDFHDPTPVAQGMSVYYGDMVYGGVGFAILADRKWKSGPHEVNTGGGRPDHLTDPELDPLAMDKPGLRLLGERQEAFLKEWAGDWRGHSMKVVLSQNPLANLATHHGEYDGHLIADLDSNGWPQTPRNRAIDLMRPAKALHLSGDQHLASLAQYGVEKQRDSPWSYCTPAIAVGYQRWWRADDAGMEHANRPANGGAHTGEYLDGFGNKVYVYAVANPEPDKPRMHRYERAHLKASGFGFVTVDTAARTYHLEAYKFLIDATDGNPANQFAGWPVTIHQDENTGDNRLR